LKKFIRNLIAKNPAIKAKMAPKIISGKLPLIFSLSKNTFVNDNVPAPRMAMIERINENLAAESRLMLRSKPVATVDPDLEIPGKIAAA